MYIKSINDEQQFKSSGLWASQILRLTRLWKTSLYKLQYETHV